MRLLIADDHELLRDTLSTYLGQQPDIVIVTAADICEAIVILEQSERFDLVLLDYDMPGMQGLQGLRKILAMVDAPPVALISGIAKRDVIAEAFEHGAQGFLHKSMRAVSLLHAIRFMVLGERFVPVEFLEIEPRTQARTIAAHHQIESAANLTDREEAVLRALSVGKTNKEIARDLGLSEATIKLHVKTLYRRLGVSNRTQAAIAAQNAGLV